MVVLDTDLLIALLRGNEEAIEKIKYIEEQGEVYITSITSYELYKGVYLSSNPTKNLIQVNNLLNNIKILYFDLESSKISAKIYSYLKKKGVLTNIMDQMIAAITISKNENLTTRNLKHYTNIPNLRIESW